MITSYLLIPGAGGEAWYWHRVTPLLEARGHRAIPVDLPANDPTAGLAEYTETALAALETAGHEASDELIVVAQSMGGFTGPLVATRTRVDLLVMLAAMVPAPGETGGAWWANTGQSEAAREAAEQGAYRYPGGEDGEFDLDVFFHDVPDAVRARAVERGERDQSDAPFGTPWPLDKWPDVPTRFLLCRHDRLFPAEFQRRVVHERLGITPDEMDGGHLPALAHPDDLVERLETYRETQAV